MSDTSGGLIVLMFVLVLLASALGYAHRRQNQIPCPHCQGSGHVEQRQ